MARKSDQTKCCSFCGRSQNEVRTLISGPAIFICNVCIDLCRQLAAQDEHQKSETSDKAATPGEYLRKLDEWVVGQEQAKRTLAVAVYNHRKRLRANHREGIVISKSNILLVGPSGCGKTLLARAVADILNVPFAIVDATPLTQAGYIGDDVETILAKLIQAAGNDPKRAASGILYLDEVDKLARRETALQRDVGGEGVQQALLKIFEGHTITVRVGGDRNGNGSQIFELDTSNILFIAGGAFSGLAEMTAKEERPRSGFRTESFAADGKKTMRKISPKHLQRYGFIPEFIGRLPIVVTLDGLDESQLTDILTKPRNALFKQFQELFNMDGSALEATDGGLRAIARLAIEQGTGARGLRAILEDLLLEAMFCLPSQKGSTYLLDEAAVANGKARKVDTKRPIQAFA